MLLIVTLLAIQPKQKQHLPTEMGSDALSGVAAIAGYREVFAGRLEYEIYLLT